MTTAVAHPAPASDRAPSDAPDLQSDVTEARNGRPRVAVLIPCYNEALTVGAVVAAFRAALPNATIYVYGNNSTDGTAEIARRAGAVVRRENRQGKGYVIQAMFRDIDADYYVMADGDGTYPANQVN